MAGLKNGANLKSIDDCADKSPERPVVALALAKQGEGPLRSVNSPAKDLQSRLEMAASFDFRSDFAAEAGEPKNALIGLTLMSAVAAVGWYAIFAIAKLVI